jgi:hypothetical protein
MGLIPLAIAAVAIFKMNKAMENDNDAGAWAWGIGGSALLYLTYVILV